MLKKLYLKNNLSFCTITNEMIYIIRVEQSEREEGVLDISHRLEIRGL